MWAAALRPAVSSPTAVHIHCHTLQTLRPSLSHCDVIRARVAQVRLGLSRVSDRSPRSSLVLLQLRHKSDSTPGTSSRGGTESQSESATEGHSTHLLDETTQTSRRRRVTLPARVIDRMIRQAERHDPGVRPLMEKGLWKKEPPKLPTTEWCVYIDSLQQEVATRGSTWAEISGPYHALSPAEREVCIVPFPASTFDPSSTDERISNSVLERSHARTSVPTLHPTNPGSTPSPWRRFVKPTKPGMSYFFAVAFP